MAENHHRRHKEQQVANRHPRIPDGRAVGSVSPCSSGSSTSQSYKFVYRRDGLGLVCPPTTRKAASKRTNSRFAQVKLGARPVEVAQSEEPSAGQRYDIPPHSV